MYKLELRNPVSPNEAPRMAASIAKALNRDAASVQRMLLKGGRIATLKDANRANRLVEVFEQAGVSLTVVPMSQIEIDGLKQRSAARATAPAASAPASPHTPRLPLAPFAFLSLLFTAILGYVRWGHPFAFGNWVERLSTLALIAFTLASLVLLVALIRRAHPSHLGLGRLGQGLSLTAFVALAGSLLLTSMHSPTPLATPGVDGETRANNANASQAISTQAPSVARADIPAPPTLRGNLMTVAQLDGFFSDAPYNYQITEDDWSEGSVVDMRCMESINNGTTDHDSICYYALKNHEQVTRIVATSNREGSSLSEPSAITGLASFLGSDELERIRQTASTLTISDPASVVKIGNADVSLMGGSAANTNGGSLSTYEVSAEGWDAWSTWYRFYTGHLDSDH